ncbi:MAG: DUF5667 domain-containing protein [Patescibacteria group bacterium]
MSRIPTDNLVKELSILGKDAQLSLTARQRVRDQLFKKMGQLDLIDAVQTKTEVDGLVMPLQKLLTIFKPQRVSFGVPATLGIVLSAFALTVTTGAFALNAQPGAGVLYTVRKAMEDVQVALVADPAKKAELKLSIASNRLDQLQSTDPRVLQIALADSRKALAEVQTALASLDDTEDAAALTAKLATIIGSQKDLLATIVKDQIGDETVQKGIVELRNELDALLPTENKPTTSPTQTVATAVTQPTQTPPATSKPTGTLITAAGVPALKTDQAIIIFSNLPAGSLSQYIGSANVSISGSATNTGFQVSKVFIDSKLVWELPTKIEESLPRVDGDQNQSLR